MGISQDDYARHLAADSAALANAADRNLDREVVACPGWDVAELLWHVGEVHRFWTRTARANGDVQAIEVPRPARHELIAWFREGAGDLERLVRELDPDGKCWTWSPAASTAAFVPRRMAQETAMHRWDAQDAIGIAVPIDPDLAVDGVDELFDTFLPAQPARVDASQQGVVHLHATDVDVVWEARLDPSTVAGGRGTSHPATVGISGQASDLLLALWRRRPLTSLTVRGDTRLAGGLVGALDLT
ncbi:MAG TPA: maleylpyruvate isomerase family mycothiol-dependent enzyme [Acidimicrobiales bacterium]|nr:maleylpyruvate isomerase family mycothiol-dependent enzyme [Acidimicrobiales bacterium]